MLTGKMAVKGLADAIRIAASKHYNDTDCFQCHNGFFSLGANGVVFLDVLAIAYLDKMGLTPIELAQTIVNDEITSENIMKALEIEDVVLDLITYTGPLSSYVSYMNDALTYNPDKIVFHLENIYVNAPSCILSSNS